VSTQAEKASRFLELHRPGQPLVLPNPWDAGSAKVLAALGFSALATTSAGFAGTKGRLDGNVTREEALAHGREIVDAVDLPVSADLENCFADDPDGVAATIRGAIDAGLAGGSVEDYTLDADDPIYARDLATERVRAAAEAAHGGPVHFVLTARCENHIRGITDVDDTVARLQAYQEAGADVLYAPGLANPDDVRAVVGAVDRPVNVLAVPGAPTVAELGELGVARVSVGSAFAMVAIGALVEAGKELLERGTYDFWTTAIAGMGVSHAAFA
jgi:2-methylisocitrate lyase-like PEP mutase family enzyme